MSSMLEQAIIDADQLKETAKKTAEEGVVEKYQDEIKEAIEKILEQEETIDAEVSLDGDTPELEIVEELPSAQTADSEEVVQIDLNQLEEMMAEELEEGELDADDMLDREQVAEELEALAEENDEEVELDESLEDLVEEEIEIDEVNLAAIIAEMINEDYVEDAEEDDKAIASEESAEAEAELASTLEETTEVELEEDKAEEEAQEGEERDKEDGPGAGGGYDDYGSGLKKESKLLQKENKSLLREQKRTNKKVHMLQEKVDKYGTVINTLKDKLNESNLTNAKLLYQNRILNSVSLNERQKDKIVEAISNATTVEEAKLIFETLQSAVGVSKKRKSKRPESLNEVVTRSSSAFIPRKEVQPKADAFSERMKRLAGLK